MHGHEIFKEFISKEDKNLSWYRGDFDWSLCLVGIVSGASHVGFVRVVPACSCFDYYS